MNLVVREFTLLITSLKNEGVKEMRLLKRKSARRDSGLHFIEGERLVSDALASGAELKYAYVEQTRGDMAELMERNSVPYSFVTEPVMRGLSDTDTPQGVCASVKTPCMQPPTEYPKGLIIALDRVQDPGNLGTIIRTADAFGTVGIILGEGTADAYSPKTMRSAMGSNYHIPIWSGSLEVELKRLVESGYTAVCGHLKGDETLPKTSENRALVIGNEGNGVSDAVAGLCRLYRLPMKGRAESLNAAIAAAILIYEISK